MRKSRHRLQVHPIKQIYHCFGCGKGGDVFKFVMEMEKCAFPEAVRIVAEKCGIAMPQPKERSPEERKENQQRAALVEIHREAQAFFVKQLEATPEGKAARAYLEDRGLDAEAIARFGIGYAPSGGDLLLRALKPKYPEKLLVESGLISRDQKRAACSTGSGGGSRFPSRTNRERLWRLGAARWATTCRNI